MLSTSTAPLKAGLTLAAPRIQRHPRPEEHALGGKPQQLIWVILEQAKPEDQCLDDLNQFPAVFALVSSHSQL